MHPKIMNRWGIYMSPFLGKTVSPGAPNAAIIETTNACDKGCKICVHKGMRRARGMIDPFLFKRIIDQLTCAEVVFPYYLGEPLLHEDICEMIAYSKSRGLYTSVSTNGNLLDEGMSRRLVDTGLDHLQVSLNSTNEEGYRMIDGDGDFGGVLENIRTFSRVSGGKVDFNISVINMGCALGDWRSFADDWGKKGVDVRFKCFVDWNAGDDTIRRFGKVARRPRGEVYPCDWLWRQLHILWDGRVVPCCFDYDGTRILGDAGKDSIEDIWNGPEFVRMRGEHLADGGKIPLCADCNRRRVPFYEVPLHILLNASYIYRLRRHYEKKPRRRFS
jgi:MoaA/NifB/PqqE/SkfB family radical SAM enzyme